LEQILRTNGRGVFLEMRACAPVMARSGQGSIINLSSMHGNAGSNGHITYGVLSLASHKSKFITGPELLSDGGATAAG
jgi:NADP-dependent 3-hydroxy acid dehydrogenase YdfG